MHGAVAGINKMMVSRGLTDDSSIVGNLLEVKPICLFPEAYSPFILS
jgi:hypothetical protein